MVDGSDHEIELTDEQKISIALGVMMEQKNIKLISISKKDIEEFFKRREKDKKDLILDWEEGHLIITLGGI